LREIYACLSTTASWDLELSARVNAMGAYTRHGILGIDRSRAALSAAFRHEAVMAGQTCFNDEGREYTTMDATAGGRLGATASRWCCRVAACLALIRPVSIRRCMRSISNRIGYRAFLSGQSIRRSLRATRPSAALIGSEHFGPPHGPQDLACSARRESRRFTISSPGACRLTAFAISPDIERR
jgi:hypothetical protein